MARLMLSAGMFSALAARMAVRRRGLVSGSPPPPLAAMLISLMRRVKILPRLASSAPFLCLIVAHLEWPDIGNLVFIELDCADAKPQESPVEEIHGFAPKLMQANRDYSMGSKMFAESAALTARLSFRLIGSR